jgi:uncharacterized BrkB/YihY/UPF0761 family membrane protein
MQWGFWGWAVMIGFCLLLVAFITITVLIVVTTYKKTKAGDYGKDDWSIMSLTSIPILLSLLAGYALYYLLIKDPFWLM